MLTCPASATTFLPDVLGTVSLYKFTVSRSKENLRLVRLPTFGWLASFFSPAEAVFVSYKKQLLQCELNASRTQH